MGSCVPIVPMVDVAEAFGVRGQKPLLLWLLASKPKDVTPLVDRMKSTYFKQGASWDSFVWGMLRMCGKFGESRLFMFEGHDHRYDLDVLSTVQGLEAEFVHQLLNRINAPRGFTPKDVVLVWGNMLLQKLDRFKGYFEVNILCVDDAPIARLQVKLGSTIDALGDVSGEGLRMWIEQRAQHHFRQLRLTDPADLLDDPYFSETVADAQMPWVPLEGLNHKRDALMIQESFCPIPPLRSTAQYFQMFDSEEECSNDGDTYTGVVRGRKRKQPTRLTVDALKVWVAANLKPEEGGKLLWAALKTLLETAFQQGKPDENLMKSAGLVYRKTRGNRYVENAAGVRLVPK